MEVPGGTPWRFHRRRSEEMKDAEGGTRTRTPRKQQRIFLPLQFSLPEVIQFVVWTMPSPYTKELDLRTGGSRLVSTLCDCN